jgi:xanthine dehydrogenase YagS FAD-binding subunit
MNRFFWVSAKTISEAASISSTTVAEAMTAIDDEPGPGKGALLKAGGIDLLDLLKEGLVQPGTVVNLREIPQLDTIVNEADGSLRIGALATLANLAAHPLLRRRYPALTAAAAASASPQIRNVATLGGNLLQRPRCWYFRATEYRCLRKGGEHCFAISGENQYHAIFNNMPCAIVHPSTAATVLVALGATLELINRNGKVRQSLLEEFFVTPQEDVTRENSLHSQEILTAIRVPPLGAGVRMAHLKQGERDSFDWPLADVAVAIDLASNGNCRSAAIILGAAAPVPFRAKAAEKILAGRRLDDHVAREAGQAALDGATPLSKNAYKLPLFETLVRRAILAALENRDG